MKETKKQKDYSKVVDKYMASVAAYIEDTQGCVPPEYQISFLMLRNNLTHYLKLMDVAEKEGVLFKNPDTGRQYIQGVWTMLLACERNINDTLKQFGLTTMSRSKIKLQEQGMTAEELLKSLTE